MTVNASGLSHEEVNARVNESAAKSVTVKNALGHRYIGCGSSGKTITVEGIPGNALGAYLNGSKIIVNGNAQDAIGDTMNGGEIIVHGSVGDTTGYAMRSGKILVKGNAGYRVGIHMKEYQSLFPTIVIGGTVGDFLGEYQAGGIIIVLGNGANGECPVGNFCAAGMHGGKMLIRSETPPKRLAQQISCKEADESDKKEIRKYIDEFCKNFGGSAEDYLKDRFWLLTPNSASPYRRLYTEN
ncbi:MAG: glutamate synthase [Ruminiclostridium sp.]|nr:glutamate synthase [Ruminiclostridium sp.]